MSSLMWSNPSSKGLASTPAMTSHSVTFKYRVNQHKFHLANRNETTCFSSSYTGELHVMREKYPSPKGNFVWTDSGPVYLDILFVICI